MDNNIRCKFLGRLSPKEASFVIEYVKDFAARRAAEASGHSPDKGHKLVEEEHIADAIRAVIEDRLENVGIDAEWLLYELVDNHRIARQQGNISASNTALGTLAKHVTIDALAKQKVDHTSSDGSMKPAPHIDAETAKRILKDIERELDGEVSFI